MQPKPHMRLAQSRSVASELWQSHPSKAFHDDITTLSLIARDGLRTPHRLPDGNNRILSQNWISFKILGLKITPF
jgi:hypothetical protein